MCSKTHTQHLEDIKIFFDVVRRNNLKLRTKKCVFFRKRIAYLGHEISAHGIHVDPKKGQATQEYPMPLCVKDVQAILGFTGYYRRFICNYSTTAHPLTQLLHKDVQFQWTSECQAAFEHLKAAH